MFIGLALLTSVSSIAMVVAGILSYLSNPKRSENRWFLYFSIIIALWVPINFVDSNIVKNGVTATFVKLDFALAIMIAWFLLQFVVIYLQKNIVEGSQHPFATTRIFRGLSLVLNLLLIVCIFTNSLFVVSLPHHNLHVEYSNIYATYLAAVVFYFGYAFGSLLFGYKRANSDERRKINPLIVGLIIAAVANILSNVISPSIFSVRSTVQAVNIIGYIGILYLVLTIYISITTRRLFDVRSVVTRSLAYLLAITTVGFIYGFIAFGIVGKLFFENKPFNLTQQIVYTILAIFLVFTFPPLQRFFNKVTNKLFYQDAYDPQLLLDQLGTLFALEINIKKIAQESLKIICEQMKLSHGRLVTINEDASLRISSFGDIRDESIEKNLLKGIKGKVISVEDDETRLQHKEEFQSKNITVIVRLVTQDGPVGYLLLGPKKTGNIYSNQDIDTLTIISNEMAVAVQNSLLFERISQFNVTLQHKVDEATKQLRKTNEKLKALDETKDDFISMASHQLRTPLTSVKGYLSMVLEGDAGKVNKQEKEMLTQASLSAQRMVYLIADLLNVSRLKTGKFVIEPTRINLSSMIQQELSQLKETATSRNLTLNFECPEHFPDVMLDETKTRQVVMNFIDNAIYYTPSGGHITVRLLDNPSTVEMHVEDDGIGVSKSDQPHLFTKFYRAGNARKARPDGTGLGLFMAKKVIIAQEGNLIFESEEGKGSTFGFSFSKARVGVNQALKAPATTVKEPVAA